MRSLLLLLAPLLALLLALTVRAEGVHVLTVKDASGPASADYLVRAIAKQAEAERKRRAKVIHAEGEFQAAEKLLAAGILARKPQAVQLRDLQTFADIAGDKTNTIVFPVPVDFMDMLLHPKSPGSEH